MSSSLPVSKRGYFATFNVYPTATVKETEIELQEFIVADDIGKALDKAIKLCGKIKNGRDIAMVNLVELKVGVDWEYNIVTDLLEAALRKIVKPEMRKQQKVL